jgi:CDP-diacylglycerol---glycerol-3-phosphate 3-phosphatidyltransferase
MYRKIPNMLTMLRAVLACVFFLVLNQYQYVPGAAAKDGPGWAIVAAIVIFIIAAITDALDGYLARRWKVESQFGRIMDPFCDKVLVMGALIYLAGARFVADGEPIHGFFSGHMVSGVYPWMVALILARELLVTGIRGELEAKGMSFGANWWGKIKFIMQAIIVPIVLGIVACDPKASGNEWMAVLRDVLIYITVIVSVVSGLPYVTGAMKHMGDDQEAA